MGLYLFPPNPRSNRIAAGTIGNDAGARLEADVLLFEVFRDALGGVEAECAAAGEHDRVDSLDHVERIQKIGLARSRSAAALRNAADGAVAVREHDRTARLPPGSVKWPTRMPGMA